MERCPADLERGCASDAHEVSQTRQSPVLAGLGPGSDLQVLRVGGTGFEPVTSSVSRIPNPQVRRGCRPVTCANTIHGTSWNPSIVWSHCACTAQNGSRQILKTTATTDQSRPWSTLLDRRGDRPMTRQTTAQCGIVAGVAMLAIAAGACSDRDKPAPGPAEPSATLRNPWPTPSVIPTIRHTWPPTTPRPSTGGTEPRPAQPTEPSAQPTFTPTPTPSAHADQPKGES